MNNPIVLTQGELEELLELILKKDEDGCPDLLLEYQAHDDEHSIISYFLLTVTDHLLRKGYQRDAIIKKIFSLDAEIWMTFFTCDDQFIDFLMRHTKNNDFDVTDELPQLVEKFHNHEYS